MLVCGSPNAHIFHLSATILIIVSSLVLSRSTIISQAAVAVPVDGFGSFVVLFEMVDQDAP